MPTTFHMIRAAGAALLLATPALAQDATPAQEGEAAPAEAPAPARSPDRTLVTEALDAPRIDALQAPSERVGEYFETNGARIFYEARGDGPAMLLLHGYPLSGALFSRVRDAVEDEFTVITLDHRGYGLSEAPAAPDDVSLHAEDALALMDHLGIEEAVIGGMSMGGPIVLSMYDRAPERFTGMILIDTTASAAGPAEAGLWRGVAEVARQDGREPIITTLIPDMLTGETRLNAPEVADYLVEVMQDSSVEAYAGGATALAERPDRTSLLPEIDVPTLVIVGLEDSLYSVQVSRDMAEAIPDGTLAIIPGGSHAAVFEAPGRVAAAIEDWAETLD